MPTKPTQQQAPVDRAAVGGSPAAPDADAGAAAGAAAAAQQQQKGFVEQTVGASVERARKVYETSAPEIVKRGVESTQWLSEPIVSRISAVAPPVMRMVDSGIDRAYSTLSGSPRGEGAAGDERRFLADAAEAFGGLQKVTYGDFARRLDPQRRFVDPAREFYAAASAKWQEQPNANLGDAAQRVRARFEAAYEEAVAVYGSAVGNPTVAQLVEVTQSRLGDAWNSRTAAYVTNVFERLRSGADEASRQPREAVRGRWETLLAAAGDAVDRVLPEAEREGEAGEEPSGGAPAAKAAAGAAGDAPSVTGLVGRVLRRVRARVDAASGSEHAVAFKRRRRNDLRHRWEEAKAGAGDAYGVAVRGLQDRPMSQLPRDVVSLARQAVGADERHEDVVTFASRAGAAAWSLFAIFTLMWVWMPREERPAEAAVVRPGLSFAGAVDHGADAAEAAAERAEGAVEGAVGRAKEAAEDVLGAEDLPNAAEVTTAPRRRRKSSKGKQL